jgi:hypothetical protein
MTTLLASVFILRLHVVVHRQPRSWRRHLPLVCALLRPATGNCFHRGHKAERRINNRPSTASARDVASVPSATWSKRRVDPGDARKPRRRRRQARPRRGGGGLLAAGASSALILRSARDVQAQQAGSVGRFSNRGRPHPSRRAHNNPAWCAFLRCALLRMGGGSSRSRTTARCSTRPHPEERA